MRDLRCRCALACLAACVVVGFSITLLHSSVYEQQKGQRLPRSFESPVITTSTPGHGIDIEVDITDGKKLYLLVTDGGNGYSCDWADWVEPRLIGPKGELKLTALKWKSASASWGRVRVGRNAGGGPLQVAGKPVAYGIGTHANSVIVYDLPPGYTRFKVRGALDNGGTNQAGGRATSVRFHVFVDNVPKKVLRLARTGGSQPGGIDPENVLAAMDVADGLEAQLFAHEPMLLSPSNMDIDPKGRVWICEVVNYRRRNGQRPEGDRILILEDTDGDGKADKSKVFYQGRDIDSAHGICLLPTPDGKNTKVIVSVGSGVYIFTDKDGDDKADGKTALFTGISGTQHDHGIHAFVFGPDGRLYFNFGNAGRQIRDAKGNPIIDRKGNVVAANRKPYQEGMVFRCNMDGSNFETLGWNFRNNWEVTVDSFGNLWQSDNDDDGNRGVRINFVMEFGNYGYRDELTGAGWRSPRTGMAKEIPIRHWHQNDPGVVPNLLQTGAGSPTGICVYEATLLPPVFRNQIIHSDAGPNIVRCYPVKEDGAGYKATIVDILRGTRDRWFRPSDVCVAPDGSLFVADWYDPGVGGHGMGDIDKGRIFRIAPPKTSYRIPHYDYSTPEGAAEALRSPTLSIRYMAWTALHQMQQRAEPALLKLWDTSQPAHIRARALWLLGQIDGRGDHYVALALKDRDPRIRITGLRLARLLRSEVLGRVEQLVQDPSPQVRRECCIATYYEKDELVAPLWAQLAAQHRAGDRWYLEALGIAARGRWDVCFDAWLKMVGDDWNTPAGRDIIWRSRATKTPEFLAKIIADPKTSVDELPRYFRAFDFQTGKAKDEAILHLAFSEPKGDDARKAFILSESLSRLKNFSPSNPTHAKALDRVLERAKGTPQFVKLVSRFGIRDRFPDLVEIAIAHPESQLGVDAVVALLNHKQFKLLRKALASRDKKKAAALMRALATARDGRVFSLVKSFIDDRDADLNLRREAVRALAGSRRGAQELVRLAAEDELDSRLKEAVAAALHRAQWRDVKAAAIKLFPLPAARGNNKIPPIAELLRLKGDPERGRIVFRKSGQCAKCHIAENFGKEVGPNLSEIGDKLSREAMFESILFPSAAISHNYETYAVALKSGNVVTGLLVSDTPSVVAIKSDDAIVRTFKRSEIEAIARQSVSLMPPDLANSMSVQELVDVVAYLTTLRKKK